MPEQTELFNLESFTDSVYIPPAEWEVTNRSTRRKTPPKRRKAIALTKENDRPSTSETHTY